LRYQLLVMQNGKTHGPDFNGRYECLGGTAGRQTLEPGPWTPRAGKLLIKQYATGGRHASTTADAVVKTVQVKVLDSSGRRAGHVHSDRPNCDRRRLPAGPSCEGSTSSSCGSSSPPRSPPIRSLIGEGTVVHGELRFADGLRIDGEVHGDVVAVGDRPSLLVISEKARVMAR
jgi:hypothetical protein